MKRKNHEDIHIIYVIRGENQLIWYSADFLEKLSLIMLPRCRTLFMRHA